MSGGSLPYHLRLNKNIERQVLIDLLTRVSSYKAINEYSYISFGGPFLEDFKVLHNQFQVSKMYSIEMSKHVISRQEFNKPSSCISCLNMTSDDLVKTYPFIKHISDTGEETNIEINGGVILWLDYTAPSELGNQILEFSSMIEKVELGSIVKITVNANPASLAAIESLSQVDTNALNKQERLLQMRVGKLEKKLGSFFLKDISTPDMLTNRNYSTVLYRTLLSAAYKALEGESNSFLPLCAFEYSDGQSMLTLTGIVLKDEDIEPFKQKSAVEGWEYFIDEEDKPMEINVPYLSVSEKLRIDKLLPDGFEGFLEKPEFQVDETENKTRNALSNYQKYYRFYPNFTKVWI